MDCIICGQITAGSPWLVGKLAESHILLSWDQYYPGYVLVCFRRHVTDLTRLTHEQWSAFAEEGRLVAQCVSEVFGAARMNVALLGNKAPHLHWHVIPRYPSEPHFGLTPWPHPRRVIQAGSSEHRTTLVKLRQWSGWEGRLSAWHSSEADAEMLLEGKPR